MKKLEDRVLIGKSFRDYLNIFDLIEEDLYDKKILTIASGIDSFCAEANLNEIETTSVDDLYFFDIEKIKAKAKSDLAKAKDLDSAKMALSLFNYDFEQNSNNYQARKLPNLNFKPNIFDLAIISNIDKEFTDKLILEAIRVAKEVRVILSDKEVLNNEKFNEFEIETIEDLIILRK